MVRPEQKESFSLFDSLKLKLLNMFKEYLKEKLENSKKEILKQFEINFERKIKREINKFFKNILFSIFIFTGLLFIILGFFIGIIYFLKLPIFLSFIFFGLFLILISLFFKI